MVALVRLFLRINYLRYQPPSKSHDDGIPVLYEDPPPKPCFPLGPLTTLGKTYLSYINQVPHEVHMYGEVQPTWGEVLLDDVMNQ